MTRYQYAVLTNPVEGREDEFNEWYTNTHVRDVLRIPGFVSAQRFELSSDGQRAAGPHPWRYFALYEIETDDLPAVLDELARRYDTADMVMSSALAPERLGLIYEAITERLSSV
ncbi:hypothetical protein NN3_22870 [Nocardia neocaledoniensis NBRC 108232]|uniref:DUF4286 family protein n=1 Tax=Nocardia neocaledoniensis TaxID=236511 RepID=A0A317N1R1_9NOCA|nr:DUF4286 family protein [Nocardia neocaledoniensis]PWV67582.1 hypothetical protein DFR69_12132 [Nocardia neocaledoniensis]GEM31280.1 hypothetical protein NN3_22870 [Nocardia neocaledoniensis NBRC 108232]